MGTEGLITPLRAALEETGDVMILAGRTLASALRPPYPFGEELVAQFVFVVRLVWLPLMITTIALNYGAVGTQAGGGLKEIGGLDRLGSFFVLASLREIGPAITFIVVSGVAGTAITADLGARKIREELDALQVLGVDPVKNLVVPRFLALMVVTALFEGFAVLFGVFGGLLSAVVYYGVPSGEFWATFFANVETTDIWGSFLKSAIFGAIIAIVCCYKGMTARGGAEGVGRAVNEAVVTVFLLNGAVNYVFTQLLLATHPSLQVLKG